MKTDIFLHVPGEIKKYGMVVDILLDNVTALKKGGE